MAEAQRAAVIGGSMSGLLAARVLSDRFKDVAVFERDVFPADVDHRKGVPQGRHAHALLCSGLQTLRTLFPGFVEELVAQGALHVDISRVRWFDNGGYQARTTGIEALLVSRPRLETHVRNRVKALPNVRVIAGHDVESLVMGPAKRVEGVRVRPVAGGTEAVDAFDLVVDASGRGSRTPAWLQEAGFQKPLEESVQIGLGYSTRIYRRRPQHLGGDIAVIIPSAPPGRRGGVALAMEGDRWMVTLFGVLGDHPPTDEAGFMEFAGSLPAPDVHDLIRDAEPLSDPLPFKFPASTRRRYERIERFPEGYLAFGDAICSFNPIYGQGMSAAALQAMALQQCLSADDLSRRFFPAAAKVIDGPWTMAVGGDLRYPSVEGPRTPMVNFINWYMGKLQIASRQDPKVTLAFHKVANLLSPPPSILHPALAVRIARGNIGARH